MLGRSWSSRTALAFGASALIATSIVAIHRSAVADSPTPDDPADQHKRCALRLSIALAGVPSQDPSFLGSATPQALVDSLVKDPAKNKAFVTRFAGFINARFNRSPGDAMDASYYLAEYVLTHDKPWSDMFQGAYDVVVDPNDGQVTIKDDANGLGYFRSQLWMKKYAGNEPGGLRIQAAYRIMSNMIGLHLTAVTNVPGGDVGATSRAANPTCAGCHVDGPFALDRIAGLLSKRVGFGDEVTFSAPPGGPSAILDRPSVADDKAIVTALLGSVDYGFQACRLAWSYLYGRDESTCEGPLFDKCLDAFRADGKIQSALLAIAKDPTYCL
jgi:hypothetical protein